LVDTPLGEHTLVHAGRAPAVTSKQKRPLLLVRVVGLEAWVFGTWF